MRCDARTSCGPWAPQKALRSPQDRPKTPQIGPKRLPDHPQIVLRRPRSAPDRPKRTQDRPKMRQDRPKMPPERSKSDPQIVPRGPKVAENVTKNTHFSSQAGSKIAHAPAPRKFTLILEPLAKIYPVNLILEPSWDPKCVFFFMFSNTFCKSVFSKIYWVDLGGSEDLPGRSSQPVPGSA